MTITFNQLRALKDRLPHGSMENIAQQLGVSEDTVRNFFGGAHFQSGLSVGMHFEEGPEGGLVHFEDDTIYRLALEILQE